MQFTGKSDAPFVLYNNQVLKSYPVDYLTWEIQEVNPGLMSAGDKEL